MISAKTAGSLTQAALVLAEKKTIFQLTGCECSQAHGVDRHIFCESVNFEVVFRRYNMIGKL